MIERLAARLQAAPEDADGWRMLGWSYFHVQQASKAAEAYARAVALRPQSPELKSAYGEALVAAEAGTVTPKALEMFNAALALDAGNAKARYFVALAMDQAGKKKEALDAWLVLQAEPLGDEPWVAELRERTQALARELKVDVSGRIPLPAVAPSRRNAPDIDGSRQPTAEEIRSIQALPADQQQVLIRGMVNGLADRLQKRLGTKRAGCGSYARGWCLARSKPRARPWREPLRSSRTMRRRGPASLPLPENLASRTTRSELGTPCR